MPMYQPPVDLEFTYTTHTHNLSNYYNLHDISRPGFDLLTFKDISRLNRLRHGELQYCRKI